MDGGLDGKRILIVEDEYWIASDLALLFARENAIVVGPAASVADGLALIEREAIDAAVLDVNLMGRYSYALADRLADEDVPYVFVTGYDGWALPEAYRDVPRIAKPFAVEAVVSLVESLCAEPVA